MMNLLDFFPFNAKKCGQLQSNYDILREEVDKIGREYEGKSYEEMIENAEPERVVTLADGARISFSIEIYHRDKNGTVACCIDAEGLPTRFGVKPSYHFYKRPNGSVYY